TEELERDAAPEEHVLGQVYAPHAAAAQNLAEPVAAEDAADPIFGALARAQGFRGRLYVRTLGRARGVRDRDVRNGRRVVVAELRRYRAKRGPIHAAVGHVIGVRGMTAWAGAHRG